MTSPKPPVWLGVLSGSSAMREVLRGYADDREHQLLLVCRSRMASVDDVRAAQAQLEEIERLRRLADLADNRGA